MYVSTKSKRFFFPRALVLVRAGALLVALLSSGCRTSAEAAAATTTRQAASPCFPQSTATTTTRRRLPLAFGSSFFGRQMLDTSSRVSKQIPQSRSSNEPVLHPTVQTASRASVVSTHEATSSSSTAIPVSWLTHTSVAALATLPLPQRTLLAIFLPSAVSKVALRRAVMTKMWPTLPTWFWSVVAVWEAVASVLASFGGGGWSSRLGMAMLYIFMGGVAASLTYIPTNAQGFTHVSGPGTLKKLGQLPLIPAVASTALLLATDTYWVSQNGVWPCLFLVLGFGTGVWIHESSPRKFVP